MLKVVQILFTAAAFPDTLLMSAIRYVVARSLLNSIHGSSHAQREILRPPILYLNYFTALYLVLSELLDHY